MANYTGIVKWFDQAKGYGFISACDGNDVFLHHSKVKENRASRDIHEGQELSFDVIQDEKGPAAINVLKLH
ncbi:MAG: cold shock domain-containing protein [Eubacteriales bacterium]